MKVLLFIAAYIAFVWFIVRFVAVGTKDEREE